MKEHYIDFLSIVRLGLWDNDRIPTNSIYWSKVKELAYQQGLSAVLVDGMEKFPDRLRPSKENLLQMIGEVMQSYESRFEQYSRSIAELAAFYNSHCNRMMGNCSVNPVIAI